ncbi:pimeloyl-ACP methyl ester carboxylesterase [Nitrospirillum amazonense]|uniref:Pimeloyl-ACP methyl ester carboxylesterase n=1 Tax=Nitrospirillum amazonense TaxID=28077 RepID=A0A560FM30_9PROT|nr:alpha/beta hydrolase [Nitrospirillum amazonense]TWB22689.1 pimeloyl-ACP methyl ester carboxylesterase [Nitrospirillum amazonense]
MTLHQVTAGDGTLLAMAEGGVPHGRPLLFLHGFGQSHRAFRVQFAGPLAREFRLLALDLRGHGRSGRPEDPAAYGDGPHWGGDVMAVRRALGLADVILVGWSYGGAVLADHVAAYGTEGIAGAVFVGACPRLGKAAAPYLGPAAKAYFPPLLSDDPAAQAAGARALAQALALGETPGDEAETAAADTLSVPLAARRAMMGRQMDGAALASFDRPALVVHGGADPVILPAMADWLAETLPQARVHLYEGVGHAPFIEAPRRFDADVAAFARQV